MFCQFWKSEDNQAVFDGKGKSKSDLEKQFLENLRRCDLCVKIHIFN
jgi:hypothetical protein